LIRDLPDPRAVGVFPSPRSISGRDSEVLCGSSVAGEPSVQAFDVEIATGKTDGDLKEALVVCRESDAVQLEKVVAGEHSQTLVSVEERMSFL